ncbi:hypothetical protein [Actinoplanes regularis]|uniref:Uncharacterized protein n=1 Tax=Actinoplanes regularis TaxID=52697 RepID=A0A239KL14_9ACTN|nr:hypothetical protein [Actinoplanes regularis]GIE92520.1 hypothetical protein Are01nite_90000 [Actinoplanes regularis]SNT18690.1 hypothetical protein SAMN06264365_1554 [Actinoplanes regularis]
MVFDWVPRWMGSPWFWVPLSLLGFGILIFIDGRRVLMLSALHGGAWVVSVMVGLGVAALGLFLAWSGYGWLRAALDSKPSTSTTALQRVSAAAGACYAIAMMVAFVVTHPRHADDLGAHTPLEVIALTTFIVLEAMALASIVAFGVRATYGRSGPRHHARGTRGRRR